MTSEYPSVQGFKALSFDCYGTIIDWVTGLKAALQPVYALLPADHKYNLDPDLLIQRLDTFSNQLEESEPTLRYDLNLAQSLEAVAAEEKVELPAGLAKQLGDSPGTWQPFPDSIDALVRLSRYFQLFILSNVDEKNVSGTVATLKPAQFTGVYTAEAIGSYKPSQKNFHYLFRKVREDHGISFEKGELLHVARSLKVDHVTAKELGLRSVWISRDGVKKPGIGGDLAKLKDRVAYEWRFDSLGAFADEVERQLGGRS